MQSISKISPREPSDLVTFDLPKSLCVEINEWRAFEGKRISEETGVENNISLDAAIKLLIGSGLATGHHKISV
jgi:hypothetical protein